MASLPLSDLRRAAEQTPQDISRWVELCAEAERQRDYAEVLFAGNVLAQLAPDRPQVHFIRGLALHYLDQQQKAIEAYQRVVTLDPQHLDGWINLGHEYQNLNRVAEAEAAYWQVITLCGQSDAAEYGPHHWNLAYIELLKGDLERGFARYPSRALHFHDRLQRTFNAPLWRGEDLSGKTLLVTVDQGHGDTILMLRYLPLLRARGVRVILEAQPALVPLLKGWAGADVLLEAGRDGVPNYDFYASEFDPPRHLGTRLDTIPAEVPYLPLPTPDAATHLPDTGKLKVALTWAGNPNHPNDHRRSLALEQIEPLLAQENIQFYALNRDKRDGDANRLAQTAVIDLAPHLHDFRASAQFIQQCDVVITCDTSIAHLAGALGKRVWVFLPFAPSWCWMLDREDSPWYPSAQLFRQETTGNWEEVITRVGKALSELAQRNV